MGFLPLIASVIWVEKYYTNYYTALWNLYGSTLTILGFISSDKAESLIINIGIITIIITIILVGISYIENFSNIVRRFGKSTITLSSTIFFSVLYFTNEIEQSISFFIFSILLFYVVSTVVRQRNIERYKLKQERVTLNGDLFSPQFKRLIQKHRFYFKLSKIILCLIAILNLAVNIPFVVINYNENQSLFVSIFFLIFIFILSLIGIRFCKILSQSEFREIILRVYGR